MSWFQCCTMQREPKERDIIDPQKETVDWMPPSSRETPEDVSPTSTCTPTSPASTESAATPTAWPFLQEPAGTPADQGGGALGEGSAAEAAVEGTTGTMTPFKQLRTPSKQLRGELAAQRRDPARKISRRATAAFDKPSQTVLVFDWDDTLFPTTYLCRMPRLRYRVPLRTQYQLSEDEREDIENHMSVAEERALACLRAACAQSKVAIITLAEKGWVELCCRNYYPSVGEFLEHEGVPVIYAKDGSEDKELSNNKEAERYWGLVKGKAIAQQVEKFYSEYPGQTWKNILSVGDSAFERFGLFAATSAYVKNRRMSSFEEDPSSADAMMSSNWEKVKDGEIMKVRAKCCKFIDEPEDFELVAELDCFTRLLPQMIALDDSFDLYFEYLADDSQIQIIEDVLAGKKPVSELPKPKCEDAADGGA